MIHSLLTKAVDIRTFATWADVSGPGAVLWKPPAEAFYRLAFESKIVVVEGPIHHLRGRDGLVFTPAVPVAGGPRNGGARWQITVQPARTTATPAGALDAARIAGDFAGCWNQMAANDPMRSYGKSLDAGANVDGPATCMARLAIAARYPSSTAEFDMFDYRVLPAPAKPAVAAAPAPARPAADEPADGSSPRRALPVSFDDVALRAARYTGKYVRARGYVSFVDNLGIYTYLWQTKSAARSYGGAPIEDHLVRDPAKDKDIKACWGKTVRCELDLVFHVNEAGWPFLWDFVRK